MKPPASSMVVGVFVSATVGVLAGIGGALLVSRSSGPGTPQSSNVVAVVPRNGEPSQADLSRIRDLNERLGRLEQRRIESKEAPEESGHSHKVDEYAGLDSEGAAKKDWEIFSSRLEMHSAEPVDSRWASTATDAFTSDFSSLGAEENFKLVGVDCRKTSCVGTLEWASYDDALKYRQDLILHPYKVNCARGYSFPEPADRAAPYRGSIIFECDRGRE